MSKKTTLNKADWSCVITQEKIHSDFKIGIKEYVGGGPQKCWWTPIPWVLSSG